MEYLVIDTESCTGNTNDGSLCSIGYAVANSDFEVTNRNDVLINPLPRRFSVGDKKNLKRTGVMFAYTVEEFRQAPTFKALYPKIKALFDGKIVLGFSMANDVKYLNDACDKFNLPRLEYEYIDIQLLYRLLNPEENSIGLKTLAERYSISYLEHRSDEDALVSLQILKAFLAEKQYSYTRLLREYDVRYGVNTQNGYHAPYSVAQFRREKGLTVSRRLQNYILGEYLNTLPKKRRGDVYCFSYAVERNDSYMQRTLINRIYSNGNSFSRDADICNVYVKSIEDETGDDRLQQLRQTSKRLKRVITLSTLKKELGVTASDYFDDSEILTEYHTKLIK